MSLNKVILIGRLGQEPTIRYMPNGEAVCNFSVATSEVYLEGRIQSRKYQGKDGIERTAYDIIANELKMLGGNAQTPAQNPQPAQTQDDISDDVPF